MLGLQEFCQAQSTPLTSMRKKLCIDLFKCFFINNPTRTFLLENKRKKRRESRKTQVCKASFAKLYKPKENNETNHLPVLTVFCTHRLCSWRNLSNSDCCFILSISQSWLTIINISNCVFSSFIAVF